MPAEPQGTFPIGGVSTKHKTSDLARVDDAKLAFSARLRGDGTAVWRHNRRARFFPHTVQMPPRSPLCDGAAAKGNPGSSVTNSTHQGILTLLHMPISAIKTWGNACPRATHRWWCIRVATRLSVSPSFPPGVEFRNVAAVKERFAHQRNRHGIPHLPASSWSRCGQTRCLQALQLGAVQAPRRQCAAKAACRTAGDNRISG